MKMQRAVVYLDDVQEFVPVDAAVSVHVVELEIPAQLVLHLSSHHQAQSGHVLHEVNVAILQKPTEVRTVPTMMHNLLRHLKVLTSKP